MQNILSKDIFNVTAEALVIPISTSGTVSDSFSELYSYIRPPFPKLSLGDTYDFKVNDEKLNYIILACSVDTNKSGSYSYYSAIRKIACSIARFASKKGLESIASPILGAGAGGLEPAVSAMILSKSFDEHNDIHTRLTICSNTGIHIETGYSIDSSQKSIMIAFNEDLKSVLESDVIINLINDRSYYHELAVEKYREFCSYDIPSASILDRIEEVVNSDKYIKYRDLLHVFDESTPEHNFLKICGELISYIDYRAYNKRAWNKYPDKRVLAVSNVYQPHWLQNLIWFKRANNDLAKVRAQSVRNALMYLEDPLYDIPMLSNKHRDMVLSKLFEQPYYGRESISYLFDFFNGIGVKCRQRMNDGVLYNKIFYSQAIKLLWIEDRPELKKVAADRRIIETSIKYDNTDLARKLVRTCLQTKSPKLDLGMCGLTSLEQVPELFQCTHVEILILSNEWSEYRNGKWHREQSSNSGSNNHFSELPNLSSLVNLTTLICGGDWDDGHGWKQRWNIKSTKFVKGLTGLTYLNLSNNTIESMEGLSKLTKLEILHLNNNKIKTVWTLKFITALRELYLSNNRIKSISGFEKLVRLYTLDLHSNLIKNISTLRELISRLDVSNSKWVVGTINIANNPLSEPPMEIIMQGKNSVLRYFEDIKNASNINNAVKVILIGNSGVGKSLLLKYFNNKMDFETEHDPTHWMHEKTVDSKYPLKVKNKVQFHLFDFGGHDIYHDTHHLFFSKNAIYILLWDKETNNYNTRQVNDSENKIVITQDYPIECWLDSIRFHVVDKVEVENFDFKTSQQENYHGKVLVVQNKADKHSESELLDQKSLKDNYRFIFDFVSTSIKYGRCNAQFDELIDEIINESELIGSRLPVFYKTICSRLHVYEGPPVVTFKDFHNYCNQQLKKNIDREQCESLGKYLHDIGLVLWYYESSSADDSIIYISKKWVIDNVKTILALVEKKQGKVTRTQILEVLDAKVADKVISIMEEFKMLFQHPYETDRFIAPLYLPDMPEHSVDIFMSNLSMPIRRFEYPGFIQKNIILSIFKEIAPLIKKDPDDHAHNYYYWRHGIIFKDIDSNTLLMIKFTDGSESSAAYIDLFILTHEDNLTREGKLFIDKIIGIITRINKWHKVEELVTLDGRHFISTEVLNHNASKGKWIFSETRKADIFREKNTDVEYFNISKYKKYINSEMARKKVVISYSKKDLAAVHTLKRYLKPLVHEGLIEDPWYCTLLHSSREWDSEIQQRIQTADIVFFLISEHLYMIDYVLDNEIKSCIKRYDDKENIKIIPIILQHYEWERPKPHDLQRFTALPFQAKPIAAFRNPNIAWYTITKSVRRMIEKDLDPQKNDALNRELEEIYERQVKGYLDDNSPT